MQRWLRDINFRQIVLVAVGFVAVLLAIGFATREDVSRKPYLQIAGSSFIFNYRLADAYYGFTAHLIKPVGRPAVIEAAFEDPAGGPPFLVTAKLTPRTRRYGLRSPPVSGVEKGRPYQVRVRLLQPGDGAVLFEEAFTVTSQVSDAVMPDAPLTVGPGYHRNPAATDM